MDTFYSKPEIDPNRRHKRGTVYNAPAYPFATMQKGDCLHVRGREQFEVARMRLEKIRRDRTKTFMTRLDIDRDGGRIWRIE